MAVEERALGVDVSCGVALANDRTVIRVDRPGAEVSYPSVTR